MGKIKSAIITTIVVLAVLVLFLFGVVSTPLPGGVNRYNGIVTGIHLGSDLTGDAYATLLPDGVITAEKYDMTVAEESSEEAQNYRDTYVATYSGAYYVDKDLLDDYADISGNDYAAAFEGLRAQLQDDASVVSARLANRRYTSYSVSVVDGVAIRVAVPTNLSYAAYSGKDNDALTSAISEASTAISYITLSGELTLRNTDSAGNWRDSVSSAQSANNETVTYNILSVRADISDYIRSVTYYAAGGNYAVRVNLTSEGESAIATASAKVAASDDTYIRFYVGETSVINLTCESAITDGSFYIQVSDQATARNYAALLNSAATGNYLDLDYSYDEVTYDTAATGANTAMYLGIAVLVIMVALMAYAIARYRLLGLVFSLVELLFCSAMGAILFLAGTTLTTIGIFTAIACLVLFAGCNFISFEAIRRESLNGRTIQGSVKLGYRKTLSGILDLHIVLLIVSIMLSLICSGEAAACGIILLIGTLASYILHWFVRFMWYATMSPVRDKYKFCGFRREALEDDE